MTNRVAICITMAAFLAASACGDETESAAPEAPAEPAEEPADEPTDEPAEGSAEDPGGPRSDTPLPEYMQEHFVRGVQIRDAIVRGDLDEAKATAQAMADDEPTAELPPNWGEHVTTLRNAAGDVAQAPDLEEAGLRLASLASACAGCHTAVGASIELDEVPAPTGDSTANHMLRHQWAIDRMWEGLATPADDRWTGGAGALVEAPLHPSSLADDRTVPADIATLAERVHSIGSNASGTQEVEQRSQLYGELLSTCHGCHSQLEGTPGED